ncbi:MAG: DUF3108 domain-containing protein [Dehalococcoidia bacterium]
MRAFPARAARFLHAVPVQYHRAVTASVIAALLPLAAACGSASPADAPSAGPVVEAVPWTPGEQLAYVLTTEAGDEVGRGILSTDDHEAGLVLEQRYEESTAPAGATPTYDEIAVTVDPSTLRPLAGRRETLVRDVDGATYLEEMSWSYQPDGQLLSQRTRDGEVVDQGTVAVDEDAYDNESSLWLWRTLGLGEEYQRLYRSANPVDRTQQSVDVRVPHRETIEVPAGIFDTWRVIFRSGRAVRTAWINIEAPHEIIRWDNGDLIFELLPDDSR